MMVDDKMHEDIAKEISKIVPKASTILDMGCGQGALTQRLVDLGYRVSSVDKDKKNYKANNKDFTQVDFDDKDRLGSFIESNLGRYDCVIGIEVIEHVEDQYSYALSLARMCRKGGHVLISTPNVTNRLSRLIFLITGRMHQFMPEDLDYGHINPCTSWELELIVKNVGLELVKIAPIGRLPLIYLATLKTMILSLLAIPLIPFQTGYCSGWCLLSVSQKK